MAFSSMAELKYVFYMIGDGMGPNAVLLPEMYRAECSGKIGREPLCMTTFPYSGQAATFSDSNGITDSSAAGTCLATGEKTTNGRLGTRPDGSAIPTIAEQLRDRGWRIGVTTSVSIDHATPGAFYAHVDKRGDYYQIGTQLAQSGMHFFGGASFYHPTDKHDNTKPSLYTLCEKNGYTFARGYEEAKVRMETAEKMILIQSHEGLTPDQKGTGMIPYALDRTESDLTLRQITETAVRFLSKEDKPFFLMVEGGAIDWAAHSNDAATVVGEVIAFDEAIQVAYDFYKQHPDETLIVITADHETGGLALGNSDYTLHLKTLQHQQHSLFVLSDRVKQLQESKGDQLVWNDVRDLLTAELGLYGAVEVSEDEDAALQAIFLRSQQHEAADKKTMYKSLGALASEAVKLTNRKAKVGWTTEAHSAAAVPVFAVGNGAERFSGWHDNSELAPMILDLTK